MENRIEATDLGEIVQSHYMGYAMSVIKDRALPDIMDGLKPVQRRILFDAAEQGMTHDKPYRKSAKMVGDVIGRFHPHGDISVYDAAVKMAQDFTYRYPLIDGHGNFGSIDGDSAAAMRYTELRLTRYGEAVVGDINKNTVDMVDNYNGEEKEPNALAGLVPNILLNGSSGIAVGMTTNMLPHNINNTYEAINYVIDCQIADEEPNIDKIIELIQAPDFPTNGVVIKDENLINGYKTGEGFVINRGVYNYDDKSNSIIITELPYKVNKAKLIEKIQLLSNSNKTQDQSYLPNIKEIRDESDKNGIRIVIELKKDANPQIIINKLLKFTPLQTRQGICSRVLYDCRPMVLNIQEIIEMFIYHASDVTYRRIQFDVDKMIKRYYNISALITCMDSENINDVINIIKNSETSIADLMEVYELTEEQAEYVCNTKLKSLNSKNMDKLVEEAYNIQEELNFYEPIMEDNKKLLAYLKTEFVDILNQFDDKRKTEIISGSEEIEDEDIIKDEDLVITITDKNIIKSMSADDFNKQGRGGKGSKGANIKDDEVIKYTLFANSKDYLMFFTNLGRVHVLKAYKIPKSTKSAKGKSLFNYLNFDFENNETLVNVFADNLNNEDESILMATRDGYLKRLQVTSLSTTRNSTKIINFKDNDVLAAVSIVKEGDEVIISTNKGISLRTVINDDTVRCMGRSAAGVIGIRFKHKNDFVVSMNSCNKEYLFTLTETGLGKKTKLDSYTAQGRGGTGIISHKITSKTGNIVGASVIDDTDDILVMTQNGLTIRISAKDVSECGRSTAGVKIVSVNEGDNIAGFIVISGETNPEEA